MLLWLNASTSRVPIMGPVQEKDTSTRVNAMKKMPTIPPALPAFASAAFVHFEGSLISKAPKKLIAKNTSIAKKMRLNTAPVAISFSFPGPKISVSTRPSTRKMSRMLPAYVAASPMALRRLRLRLRK